MAKERRRKWIAAGTAIVLVGFVAIATGLGAKGADWVTGEGPESLSFAVEEQYRECGLRTYLPNEKVVAPLQEATPDDWIAFQHQPGAAFANKDIVKVSIEGDSERKITLAGIRFDVERRQRQDGATMSATCERGWTGRAVEVDLEAEPPLITSSDPDPGARVAPAGEPGSDVSRVRFPWTVSLADPFQLYVVANARTCDCVWTAEIPWKSEGERGVIQVDDAGRGFRVVGSKGLFAFLIAEGEGWHREE